VSDHRPVLAVFGGSFNPPHLGHALLPAYLFARELADRVVLAPCYVHALGKALTPFDRRVAMSECAVAHYPGDCVWVTRIEEELALAHGETAPKPSFTLVLLRAIADAHPKYRVRLVIGSDITSTGETEKWHRWDQIEKEFTPIVVPRAGFCAEGQAALPDIQSRHLRPLLDRPPAERSADEQALLKGALPASVLRLLDTPFAGCLWVVGSGNAATHLMAKVQRAAPPFECRQISARALLDDGAAAMSHLDVSQPPKGVWILAKDHACDALAAALHEAGLPTSVPILHGAGSRLSSVALRSWRAAGGPAGTLHPICSLRRERTSSLLDSAGWGVEGDDVARELALELVGRSPWLDLQGLDAVQRSAYHAACALVANHVAVLVAEGRSILAGLVPADDGTLWHILDGLVNSAVGNLMALGIPSGVSGPVARGETEVARRHAAALGGEAGALYRHLSERLATLLLEK
jgi:nicotinate-nucleotide adenylyltransferase